jgi:hypothetical protein
MKENKKIKIKHGVANNDEKGKNKCDKCDNN